MRKAITVLLIAMCFVGLGAVAMAEEAAQPATEMAPTVLAVDVPGTGIVFMRVRVSVGDMTIYEYRELIWQRLADALRPGLEAGQPLDGSAVRIVVPEKGDPQIYVADHLIVEVDEKHAALNQSTQIALAEVWAANLALALDRWAWINRPLR